MQYSPKLKKAAEEIKEILKKHDIAGMCVLHTPGFAEYINDISPSYSCAKREGDGIRIKASKDFYGSSAVRDKALSDTSNMLHTLSDVGGKQVLLLMSVSDQLDKLVNAEHEDGGHSSHTTQNN